MAKLCIMPGCREFARDMTNGAHDDFCSPAHQQMHMNNQSPRWCLYGCGREAPWNSVFANSQCWPPYLAEHPEAAHKHEPALVE